MQDPATFGLVTLELGPDDKRMRLRYAGTCRLCGRAHDAGADAIYERTLKVIRCVACPPKPVEVLTVDGPILEESGGDAGLDGQGDGGDVAAGDGDAPGG